MEKIRDWKSKEKMNYDRTKGRESSGPVVRANPFKSLSS